MNRHHSTANRLAMLLPLLAALNLMTSCATTQPRQPLAPNEARVSGRQATPWVAHQVLVSLEGQPRFQQTLVAPSGPQKLRLHYTNNKTISSGVVLGAVVDAVASKYDKTVSIDLKSQHEYYVDCIVKTIIIGFGDVDFRITDTTTGQVVLETHGKTP